MTSPKLDEPLFYYLIQIGDREFPLVIMRDGTSQWDDHTGRRRLRHSGDQYLELAAFAGDSQAFQQLSNECLEFTISVPVPEMIFAKAAQMSQIYQNKAFADEDLLAMSAEEAKDVDEMERLLTDFFWKEINPLLSQPIKPRRH